MTTPRAPLTPTLPTGRIADPTHVPCAAPLRWSRGNLSEFLPGVVTPLTWDFWSHSERAGRRIYYRLGLATRAELTPPSDPASRTTNVFHGRPVANVDALRGFIDRAPGDAGDSFERQLLGESDLPKGAPRRVRKRTAQMTAKTLLWTLTFPRELERTARETDAWWRGIVTRTRDADLDACKAMLTEIVERLVAVSVVAGFGTLGGQIAFARLEAAVPEARRSALPELVSAGAALAELQLLDALWETAHGKRSLSAFLTEYGFYGPSAGECSEPSWRESPSQLNDVIAGFQTTGAAQRPSARSAERHARAARALDAVSATMSPRARRNLVRAVKRVERYTVWREAGKAASLQAYDAMRATARRMGQLLVTSGDLRDVDDIFYFTLGELAAAPLSDMEATAHWRRARRQFYSELTMPDAFIGEPIVHLARAHEADAGAAPPLAAGESLQGTGVSPGTVEGFARIVRDPRRAGHLRAGDILVCAVTDPAWSALFARAGGLITDIGGMLSHGAVIARELGLPAVVNTRGGTARIPDGARVRIDGSSGAVTILAPPSDNGGAKP